MKKIPREYNPSDMMTHAPSSAELQKFLPMVGLFERECADGPLELVKTLLATRPSCGLKLASAVLACMAVETKSESCPAVVAYPRPLREEEDWHAILVQVLLIAMVFMTIGFVAGWKIRGWWSGLWAPAAVGIAPHAASLAALGLAAPLVLPAPLAAPRLAAAPLAAPPMATKSTQSQCRYTYWWTKPQFVPLAASEHGCWELAR